MTKSSESNSTDFFRQLPTSRQHVVALAILFILPLILFFGTTLGGKEIKRHDITQFRASAESIIDYREEFGEEPLWASNVFGGMPAFVISARLQVPHLDFIKSYFKKIYPAFEYWIMLSGMYVLLILMGFRPLSAVFGSLLYGLTTYFPVIIMAGHTSKFFALAFVPWTIAGYWLITRSNKRLFGLLLFTAAMALEVRAGHPQITYYFTFLIGALWVYDSFNYLKSKSYKVWGLVTGFLIIGGVFGLFGSAEKTLSQQNYAQYSIRGGSDLTESTGLDSDYAFLWSQGITETLTLIMPDIFGGASPDYWGPKSSTSGPHYLGALSFLFLIIALFKVRDKVMYLFFGMGGLAILFSWGGYFTILNQFAFDYIPFFDKFRAPETWLVLTSFCFAVVAVYGLDKLIDLFNEKDFGFKNLYKPLGTALGIFVVSFIAINQMDFVKQGEIDRIAIQIAQQNQVSPQNPQVQQRASAYVNQQLVPSREEKAKKDALRLGLFLLLGSGIIYGLSSKKLSPVLASLGVIILAGADMIAVDQRYMNEQSFVPSNMDPERIILAQKRDIDTFIEERIDENSNYPYRVLPLLDNPFSNNIPSYYYPSIGGYSGAKLSLIQDVFMVNNNPLFSGQTGINLNLLRVLNVKYITYTAGLSAPGLVPVFNGRQGTVYELQDVLPKAFFVDSAITVNDPAESYQYLFPGGVDFANTAVVENYSPEINPDSSSIIEVVNYNGAEMTLQISRTSPGFLVLSEIYYPDGWIAELNGEEIPIYKTNYLLRGMQIPAGEHTLTLDFRPSSYYNGVKLNWISLSFQLLLGLYLSVVFFMKKSKSE